MRGTGGGQAPAGRTAHTETMAYVRGFEHDVFISYSHVDNLTAEGGPGWVERFHKYLQVGLDRRLGRMGAARIWRDRRLEPIQEFDQAIFEALEGSAVFLALVSNGYLESEYCLEEARRFRHKIAGDGWGEKIGDRRRMAIALLNNIPHDSWPEPFAGTSGAPFHDAEEPDDLGDPTSPGDTDPFRGQLKRLRDSLYRLLVAFHEETEPEAADEAAAAGPAVFLADVVDSQRAARTRLAGELQRKGVQVLGSVPPPWESGEHEREVAGLVERATLSVHLLDAYPGRPIQGDESSTYDRKQVELALAGPATPLVWVPRELTLEAVEDDAHRELLDRLENGSREGGGHEFVRGTQAALAAQIVERIEELAARGAGPAAGSAVLLDTHLKDQLHALELSRLLLAANVQPYINPQEDDPRSNLDVLEARLREVKTLMILYGSVGESWVRERLGAALQLSVTKGLPLESFCVYLAPPSKPRDDLDFSFGPVTVPLLDGSASSEPQPAILAPLLAQLGAAAG